jgi:uncharacterized protein
LRQAGCKLWDVVTDLVQIRLLAREKEAENLEFRRHLRAHHGLEDGFDATAQEVAQQVDCTQCANCCRETKVDVAADEVKAIAEHLGCTEEQARHEYTEVDAADHRRILRQPDGACVFLDGNLCMIYEARPRACRDFPYVGVHATLLGTRMSSMFSHAWFCPIMYNAIEMHKHRVGYHPR